jgi:mono/diheme cytochrome c family protein
MKRTNSSTSILTTSAVILAVMVSVSAAWAQFGRDKSSPKIDVSSYPTEIQKDYELYRVRCSTCHTLGPVTRMLRAAPTQQQFWLDKMKAMPSTDFSDQDAKRILAFLSYDASHHVAAPADNATDPKAAGPIAEGRQLYKEQSCNLCHAIGGEGGSGGPALDNVGRILTPEKLTQKINAMRAGTVSSMPPLPSTTTDEQIQSLVAFLSSLKGEQ